MSKIPQSFKHAQSTKILVNFSSQLLQQQQLLVLVKSVLPVNLADHAQYCVISGNKVLIYTDNAVWASQLRFHHSTLMETITGRNRYVHIEQLQIRILAVNSGLPTPRFPKIPTQETTDFIRHAIPGTEADLLKQAVNSLCCTLEKVNR